MAALCPETVAATATARPERPRWKAAAFTGIIGTPFPPAPPVHDDPENLQGLPHPQRTVRLPQRPRAGLTGRLGARRDRHPTRLPLRTFPGRTGRHRPVPAPDPIPP